MNEQTSLFDTLYSPEPVVYNIKTVTDEIVTQQGKYEINDCEIVLNPESKEFSKGRAIARISWAELEDGVKTAVHLNARSEGMGSGVSSKHGIKHKSVKEAISCGVDTAIEFFKKNEVGTNSCISEVERQESRGMIKILKEYNEEQEQASLMLF